MATSNAARRKQAQEPDEQIVRVDANPPPPRTRDEARAIARAAHERMTDEEDDEIVRGALWDPDSLLQEEVELRRKGKLPRGKRLATVQLDQDVVDFFVKDGPGWQARINAALRKAAGLK